MFWKQQFYEASGHIISLVDVVVQKVTVSFDIAFF